MCELYTTDVPSDLWVGMQGYRHSCNKLQNEKGKLGDKSQKRNVEQGADVAVESG